MVDLRPDPDSSLCAYNVSASAQTVQFITGHEKVVSLVLRGSAVILVMVLQKFEVYGTTDCSENLDRINGRLK